MKNFIIILLSSFYAIMASYSQEKIEMKNENGVYTIPCVVNNLRLRFIFDTGASDVSISAIEAAFMLKNGYLNENDFINSQQYILADGSIEENAIINIRELKIGSITLTNIKACVSKNISAPLLLGQSAISKLGRYYIESSYLYLGETNTFDDNMTNEERYTKAMEFAKKGDIDIAFDLLCRICKNDSKYRKDLILLVLNNNYTKGLKIASEESVKACNAGDMEILYIIDKHHAILAPSNKEDNFNYYKILYNRVSKRYAHELASAYYCLNEPNIDEEEYITYLKDAATQCEVFSKELASKYYNKLGDMYRENVHYAGVIDKVSDKNKCLDYYKKSAQLGNSSSMYSYGYILLENEDLDTVTKTRAINWIKKAAEMNNEDAIDYLFSNYYYGDVLEQDYNSSIKYGEKILDISDNSMARLKANAFIGLMYYDMKKYDEAITYLKTASYQNDAIKKELPTLPIRIKHIYATLGDCYYFGNGINKDYLKAYKLYQNEYQIDKENTYCIWRLGDMNDHGIGTTENRKLAFKYFKEGANRGDSECQDRLASCYYFGSGYGYPIEKDYSKAIYWSNEAISNGNMFSYIRLGWIYSEENSIYYNITEAVRCFQVASDNNIGLASYSLAEIYEKGNGHIKKNYKLAEKYYRLALEQGYTNAKEKLSQFE